MRGLLVRGLSINYGRLMSSQFHMNQNTPAGPIVVVLGTTGVGKSQLAVEVARQFNGEIINADAMQMYKGSAILTNKVSPEQCKGVPHHLLDFIELHEQPWTVQTFVTKALDIIKDVHVRNKLPVIVGGSHYYVQSLIFNESILNSNNSTDQIDNYAERLAAPTDQLLRELQILDPISAAKWHPNDRRKIQRALEICLTTGQPASQVYASQSKNQISLSSLSQYQLGQSSFTRFPTLILWPYIPLPTLFPMLDSRVDAMISDGLLDEVIAAERIRQTLDTVDPSRGFWVAIGYKEFRECANLALNGQSTDTLLYPSIDNTKRATRRYAKSQLRWLRIKLLNSVKSAHSINSAQIPTSSMSPYLHLLVYENVRSFQCVTETALSFTQAFLNRDQLSSPFPSLTATQISPPCITSLPVSTSHAAFDRIFTNSMSKSS